MNRFRKKSETRPNPLNTSVHSQSSDDQGALPELPPANDFRTSLILPDLSRRFSLLKTSTGEPVSFEHLKSRLAEQRARGVENQISEEEEDMILATLGRFRSRNAVTPQASQENVVEESDSSRQSVRSSSTVTSSPSITSSPSARSPKRYSNNLFGSGRFRDYTYMRSVAQTKQGRTSLTPTELSTSLRGPGSSTATDSLRPVTPEGSGYPSSPQSSPNERRSIQTAPIIPPAPYGEQAPSTSEPSGLQSLKPAALKRASMALEQAIKEMEEEVDDEILLPRSPVATRGGVDQSRHSPEGTEFDPSPSSSSVEAGMAISSDKQIHSDTDEARASPIPSRIVPGYIPGMPRPMTPRDFDLDEQRSHSTTPRATSPMHTSFSESSSSGITSSLLRRDSTASTARQVPRSASPHSTTPLFLQRTPNGRYTPEDSQRGPEPFTIDPDNPLSILARRRPASPLANQTFQPLTVSSSRPTTPSVWPAGSNGHQKSSSGHTRNGSWTTSEGAVSSDGHDLKAPAGRSLQSPALPDSPIIDHTQPFNPNTANGSAIPARPPSAMSRMELGSPALNPTRIARSPTPTQIPARSPTSPTFDLSTSSKNGHKRSSKQGSTSSPFSSAAFNSLMFSPIANSSRSSLESAGSSYHSTDGENKDRMLGLFADPEQQQQSMWHDVPASDKSFWANGASVGDDTWDPEDVVTRYAGLKKSDFMAIQEKLVSVALAKNNSTDSRDRAPSLRRRRPSTSQSNYSYVGRDRVASPQPQITVSTNGTASTPTPEQYSKASALLNSVVDSIESPKDQSSPGLLSPVPPSPSSRDVSPISRRNRDLAQVLFGPHGDESPEPPKVDSDSQPPATPLSPNPQVGSQEILYTPQTDKDPRSAMSPASPYVTRHPSTPRLPHDEAELTREVQQKIDAATRSLNKLPLSPSMAENSPTLRKRINPQQIGAPHLISASTSVDTIPLRPSSSSSQNQSQSKMSRFKILRGSLRAKPPQNNEDTAAAAPSSSYTPGPSPPASQLANYDSARLRVPGAPVAVSASASESKFKLPIPNPPASAGPSFRGFMARFRGKSKGMPETVREQPHAFTANAKLSPISSSPTPMSSQNGHLSPAPASPLLPSSPSPVPVPEPVQEAAEVSESSPVLEGPPPVTPRSPPPQLPPVHTSHPSTDTTESLKQLFSAASSLGLDPSELNALLVRSHSTSSKSTDLTLLARNNSSATLLRQGPREGGSPLETSYQNGEASAPVQQPTPGTVRPFSPADSSPVDQSSPTSGEPQQQPQASTSTSAPVRRKSQRKTMDGTRRPRENLSENAQNVVVRRTLIIPSSLNTPEFDLSALVKATGGSRRVSLSVRSIHDRVPTPPPPKSPTGSRFSTDGSPPVPLFPNALSHLSSSSSGNAGSMLPSPIIAGAIEKTASNMDSLYEFYTGNGQAPGAPSPGGGPAGSPTIHQGDTIINSESMPALELLEMANGETIWQIVNGLRDEDEDDTYTTRNSFASEYSTRENDSGLQIFVKDHGRSSSKASNTSFVSRKKQQLSPGTGKRPETKVYHTTNEQIGRLIESLSQGMDSGSFNFMPSPRAPGLGHSASSSMSTTDIQWTMEEKVDHMLKVINPQQPT
ncbi:hypothetical protein BDN72DRAFT_792778 [Pluteus cervinus]|uniref:Uncharacterized protein n=1 Tax=Pluteus cervinus TaxID=181527 RepID=A0ACD3B2B7_9AGAR|nr:hypothetical protein BDN72DRAFT_792778 [Pluteus cervinus]